MDEIEHILARARQRALDSGLGYAGALMPEEAFALLTRTADARLVDVRTRAEWDWVGRVPGSILIEWNNYPGGARNVDFVRELETRLGKTDAPVMFLCRSGQRSHNAALAATAAGYPNCFNVLEGFEGNKNAEGQRNTTGGWRVAGLPWEQD